jgi:hypothetical protein
MQEFRCSDDKLRKVSGGPIRNVHFAGAREIVVAGENVRE